MAPFDLIVKKNLWPAVCLADQLLQTFFIIQTESKQIHFYNSQGLAQQSTAANSDCCHKQKWLLCLCNIVCGRRSNVSCKIHINFVNGRAKLFFPLPLILNILHLCEVTSQYLLISGVYLRTKDILDAFTKSQKVTISFTVSVYPSIHLHAKTHIPLGKFSWNFIFEHFSKVCRENSTFIKICQE